MALGKDLLPIELTTSQPNLLAVPADTPTRALAEVVCRLGEEARRQAELRLGGQRKLLRPDDGAVQAAAGFEAKLGYNEWHAEEHVPERLEVLALLWGRR